MSAEDPRTLTELSDYIQSLVAFEEGGASGYEASADAMWKAAAAAFNLVAREVGATGFQASWSALKFYGEVMHIECPFSVFRIEDALYPQYDLPGRLASLLEEHRGWLRDEARKKLAGDLEHVAEAVERHWRKLAAAS